MTDRSPTIRHYSRGDARATLRVFLRAVHITAAADYSPEQIAAWTGPSRSIEEWSARREATGTLVAEVDSTVVGFTDVDATGYVDMMFVDPDHGRRGVATALLSAVVDSARAQGVAVLSVHASITARPFFERNGFVVVEHRRFERNGVSMTNLAMSRTLY